MTSNTGSSHPGTPPRGGWILAVSLGLLTFVVTGVIAVLMAIPSLFLGKVWESFNPLLAISKLFSLRDLGGFFAAQMILIALLAILGDLGTAILSWLIHRSRKWAVVTFFSALTFQIVAVAFAVPATLQKSQATMDAAIKAEHLYTQYASIGAVEFELQDPFKQSWGINGKLVELSLSKKLILVVPVSVLQAGTYQVNAYYRDTEIGSTPMKEIRRTLSVGTHIFRIEFPTSDSCQYGFSDPGTAKGIACVQLGYLASKKEIMESFKAYPSVDRWIFRQFIKDAGLEKGVPSDAVVNKFVAEKEIRF